MKVLVEIYVEEMYAPVREKAIRGVFTFVAIDDNKKLLKIDENRVS